MATRTLVALDTPAEVAVVKQMLTVQVDAHHMVLAFHQVHANATRDGLVYVVSLESQTTSVQAIVLEMAGAFRVNANVNWAGLETLATKR